MNTVIHIGWDGPYDMDAIKNLNKTSDCGVYQIYGPSPTYGKPELLYIGQACRTFGERIPEHQWVYGTRDSSQVSIYVGRLTGTQKKKVKDDVWAKEIDMAERLLINAHYPPYNTKKEMGTLEPELQNVHVLNWNQHRDLLPEVSGARWSSLYYAGKWQVYGPRKNPRKAM